MIRHYRTLPYVSKRLPGGFANVEIVSVECSQVVKRKKFNIQEDRQSCNTEGTLALWVLIIQINDYFSFA